MDTDNDGIITIDEFMEACRTVKISTVDAYNLLSNSIVTLRRVRSGVGFSQVGLRGVRPDLE